MQLVHSCLCLLVLVSATVFVSAAPQIERRGISRSLMDDLKRYIQFSSGADQLSCPSPVGTTLVTAFQDAGTDTQGFIARDDDREEIIVAYRGSTALRDFITDLTIALVDFSSPGVSGTDGVKAHKGFLNAFNSVVSVVNSTVAAQLEAHPTYSLISTGHSLGAALASLGGISLASNFPGVPLRAFTFGQPRTGDSGYATLAENLIGVENIFRAVETYDGVATAPPVRLGYEHHGTQYWVSKDPSTNPNNVVVCNGREDPNCSDKIPSTGINDAHLRYFGQIIPFNTSICT